MDNKNTQSYIRSHAEIVRISDIHESEYFKVEKEFSPDYILIGDKQVSRVNLIGVVVSFVNEPRSAILVIDDGSAKIEVHDFEKKHSLVNIGSIVKVIGKPRLFSDKKYVVGEIIKLLENPKWLELRKLQLGNKKTTVVEEKAEVIEEEIQQQEKNIIDLVLEKIKQLDKGEGADIEEIISALHHNETESTINNLIKEGEIFELKKGRVKLL